MEEKEKLKKIYEDLGSFKKVSQAIGLSMSKTRLELLRHKIIEIDYSIDLQKLYYLETQSVRKCAAYFDCSTEHIREILMVHEKINKPVLYSCNENFFAEDTEASFYWAGFIAADGCLLDKHNILNLALSLDDNLNLEKFKLSLCAENPIHDYLVKSTRLNYCDSWKSEIKICSASIWNSLHRFNITPRKTHTLEFPEWLLQHKMVNHFMRGYFDGDGSVYSSVQKGKLTAQLYFNLLGTKEFLNSFLRILECNLGIENKKVHPRDNIFKLEFGGNNLCKKIYEFLYKDATIYLDRKKNKVDNHYITITGSA
jgi:hypothetical protein